MVQRQRLAVKAPRFKLRGNRLVDAEPGLLGLVAGSGSNWSEGWGVCWGVLAARTGAGDKLGLLRLNGTSIDHLAHLGNSGARDRNNAW